MRIRVLLVDDDEDMLFLTSQFLQEIDSDIELSMATSGSQALSKFTAEYFDIVVSDYEMSGMDGLELLARLRAVDNFISCIIFTGLDYKELVAPAPCQGVDHCLRKSGDLQGSYDELANAIRSVVEQKKNICRFRGTFVRI